MEEVTLDEISVKSRQKVIEKWEKALKDGWSDDLWSHCAICLEMDYLVTDVDNDEYVVCPRCPCYRIGFCKCTRHSSKLCRDSCETGTEWRNNVKDFITWVKASMEMETEGDKT